MAENGGLCTFMSLIKSKINTPDIKVARFRWAGHAKNSYGYYQKNEEKVLRGPNYAVDGVIDDLRKLGVENW